MFLFSPASLIAQELKVFAESPLHTDGFTCQKACCGVFFHRGDASRVQNNIVPLTVLQIAEGR